MSHALEKAKVEVEAGHKLQLVPYSLNRSRGEVLSVLYKAEVEVEASH